MAGVGGWGSAGLWAAEIEGVSAWRGRAEPRCEGAGPAAAPPRPGGACRLSGKGPGKRGPPVVLGGAGCRRGRRSE